MPGQPEEKEGEDLDKTSAPREDQGHGLGCQVVDVWNQSMAEPGISRSPLVFIHQNKSALWLRESGENMSSEVWGGEDTIIQTQEMENPPNTEVNHSIWTWGPPLNFLPAPRPLVWPRDPLRTTGWGGSDGVRVLRPELKRPPCFCPCQEKNVPRLAPPPGRG